MRLALSIIVGPIFPNVGQKYMQTHGNCHDDNYQFQKAKIKALSDMKDAQAAIFYAERIAKARMELIDG